MRIVILTSSLALALAGCATTGEYTQVAQANPNCKVYPIETATIAGGKPRADSLRQREAQMWLGTSDYRFRTLARDGPAFNNLEEALRECNR